jgi:hypothetical protein
MADVNQQAQDLAEIMERVNDEMRRFGRVTEETQDALKAGSFRRARELDQASKLSADALGDLAGAGLAAAKSMYDGEKGAAAFNSSLDSMTKAVTAAGAALTFLMPGGFLVKALIGLGTAAVGAGLKMTQAANTMADQLFAANTKMAKSGAAASDGMMGMFRDAKKLGLSMKEMGVYTDLVAANSAELALFKGTAFEGRKAFANIGASMKPFRASLEAAGISLEDQTAGLAGYLRLQTQIGQSQNMTQQQLANGAKNYLIQMDGLSKLTGMQREEIEKQMEAARNEQRFRAKLDGMRASGDAKQIAAADRLERANILISKQAPELGQAFRDASSGVLSSDAAVKGLIGTQGKLLEVTDQLTSGQIDEYQSFQQLGRAAGQFSKDLNFTAQLGLLNDFSIDYAQAQRIGIAAQRDVSELAGIIQTEQNKQLGAQNDANTKAMADLREKQRELNERLETVIANQISTAVNMGHALANVTSPLVTAFEKLAPAIESLTKLIVKALEWLAPKLNSLVGGVADVVMAEGAEAKVKAAGKAGLTETAGGIGMGVAGAKLGATGGAIIGSVVPVIGTAIGAALGGLLGGATGFFAGRGLGRAADASAQDKGFMDQLKALVDEKIFSSERRAAGGPVRNRTPYLVGERGPELMVPEQSGNIVNNDQLTKMMSMGSDVNNLMAKMSTSGNNINGAYKSIAKTIEDFSKDHNSSITKVSGDITSIDNTTENVDKTYQAILKTVDEFSDKSKNITTSMITTQRDTLLQNEKIENFTEQNARKTKDFSTFYGQYIDKMTQALDEDLEAITGGGGTGVAEGGDSGSGGAGGANSGAGGGTGGFISRLMNAIGYAGGGGAAATTQQQTAPGYDAEGRSTGGGGDAKEKTQQPSGSQGQPRKTTDGAIFHHTGGRSLSGAIATLKSRGLGYHYMIDRDGSIVPYMPDNTVAYHAGPTDKNPKFGNWNTIGIAALANNNEDLTQEQLRAAVQLNRNLASKFGYSSQNVFGHGSVTSRKSADEGAGLVGAIKGGLGNQSQERVPQAKKGGILSGPKSGFNAILHDTEAVVPLPDGKSIPVNMKGQLDQDIVDSKMSDITSKINDIQKFSNPDTLVKLSDITSKINDIQKFSNQDTLVKLSDIASKITTFQKTTDQDMSAKISDMASKIDAMQDFGLNLKNNLMADGGITQGPSIAGEAGPEAVVPLPDGRSIPVAINFKDIFKDFSFAGMSALRGYNAGPMSTDLNAVKEIAAGMGAFDKATQTITDVNTWREIINSGVAMNYDLGVAKIGTEMIPNIGQEMGQRISEIVAEKGVDQMEAFRTMANEFKEAMRTAMPEILERMAPDAGNNDLRESLDQLIAKQSEANDISKKILQVSTN